MNEPTPFNRFHALWTKAVGAPGYDKGEWLVLESLLFDALAAPRAPLSSGFLDAYRKKLARGGSFMREEVAELLAAHDSLLEAYHETAPLRAAPRALEGPPQLDEFRGDADYLARDVLNRCGEYAHPVGHEDETHEDCLIRAAQRILDFPALGAVSCALPEPPPTDADEPPWDDWFSCPDCFGWFYGEPVAYESGDCVCASCAEKRDKEAAALRGGAGGGSREGGTA